MIRLWLVAALALPWAAGAWADEWGEVAVVSATLGVQDNRLCLGEGSRGAIGCPSYAPSVTAAGHVSVTGNLSAAGFIGDGSGLTNLPGGTPDRIVSGTAAVIANGNSNSISITEAGVTTGYYYNGQWVAGSISTTGTGHFNNVSVTSGITVGDISGTNAYFTNYVRGATMLAARYSVPYYEGSSYWVPSGGSSTLSGYQNLILTTYLPNKNILISPTGNVGIGINSPVTQLEVSGTVSATNFVGRFTGDGSGLTGLSSGDRITSGTTSVIANNSDQLSFTTTGTEKMSITSTGLVYITPNASGSAALQVRNGGNNADVLFLSSSNGGMRVYDGGNNARSIRINPNSSRVEFYSSSNFGYLGFSTNNHMAFSSNGNIGVGTLTSITPTTLFQVSGTIRIANSGEACDTDRSGAIRYAGSQFQVCYGTGGWANLADASSTVATADRITSGTAAVIANGNSNSISITEAGVTTGYYYNGIWVAGGVSTTGRISATSAYVNGRVGIGIASPATSLHVAGDYGSTANALTIDNTNVTNPQSYTFGFNSSYAGGKQLMVNGSGSSAAGVNFGTNTFLGMGSGNFANTIFGAGKVGIGAPTPVASLHISGSVLATSWTYINANVNVRVTPTAPLEVSGTISATVLQLADNPANTCGPGTYGSIKVVNGRQYTCRP